MIAPNRSSEEDRVLAIVDAAFAEARALAGEWITCHAGCDDCCRRPFAITAEDAHRLRQGLATLPAGHQAEIRERAAEARDGMANDFPGHLATAALTDRIEWREWFFARHTGVPCPVLDRHTGGCRLYAFRPVACRLAGPLIQIGATQTDPCPLCFPTATAAQIAATKIVIRDEEFREASSSPETLIAFALSQ